MEMKLNFFDGITNKYFFCENDQNWKVQKSQNQIEGSIQKKCKIKIKLRPKVSFEIKNRITLTINNVGQYLTFMISGSSSK